MSDLQTSRYRGSMIVHVLGRMRDPQTVGVIDIPIDESQPIAGYMPVIAFELREKRDHGLRHYVPWPIEYPEGYAVSLEDFLAAAKYAEANVVFDGPVLVLEAFRRFEAGLPA